MPGLACQLRLFPFKVGDEIEKLEAHGCQRRVDHLGGLGPKVQAEPGLEPRLGRGSGKSSTTLRAGCAASDCRVGQSAHSTTSRDPNRGRRQDANSARRAVGALDTREDLYSDIHHSRWDDCQNTVARTEGLERSVGRWRSGEGAPRRPVVDSGKRSVGNRNDRRAMKRRMFVVVGTGVVRLRAGTPG
jgi:hypothetical protein